MSSSELSQQDYYQHDDIKFEELAQAHEEFGRIYEDSKGHLDWQDPQAVQALTKALLKRDFNLNLITTKDRLCPPIPVRFNYIRWIQELLDTTGPDLSDRYEPEREVIGLDIGTGATCIYPLLACSSRPQWRMIGTDIDSYSLELAKKNIETNDLRDRIRLCKNTPDEPLLRPEIMKAHDIDFVMCNPPFYSSQEDMDRANEGKTLRPHAVCTGAPNEMICEGGDIGFAIRILEDSLRYKEHVQWYTCMLGRSQSAQELVALLKKHGISNFAVTNLRAGQKTTRWAVAWSFQNYRPRVDVARHGSLTSAVLAPPTERTIAVPDMLAQPITETINDTMSGLDLTWKWRSAARTGLAIAAGNVWSRSARRKKKMVSRRDMDIDQAATKNDSEEDDVALAVKLLCEDGRVQLRWLRGDDTLLLESFIGFLRNALGMRKGL